MVFKKAPQAKPRKKTRQGNDTPKQCRQTDSTHNK